MAPARMNAFGIPTKLHKLLLDGCVTNARTKTMLHEGEVYYKLVDGDRAVLIAGLPHCAVSGALVREWLATDPGQAAALLGGDHR